MRAEGGGGGYGMDVDAVAGQTRKLTAVAMLTPPTEYAGGDLELHTPEETFLIPRTQGTIVVFQPWIHHQVTKIHSGVRQTINFGFWGPPFR